MNPESLPRRGSTHRRKKGVAIVTVLSIIALMTILVVSLFNLAQSQQVVAQGATEIQRVNAVKDTAINLVMAQIREATTMDGTVWTSQPGAIRTFHHNIRGSNRIYKLYSSRQSMIRDVAEYDVDLTKKIEGEDLGIDWAQKPDDWVNLNQPLRSTDPQHPDAVEYTRFFFPIADPRSKAVGFKLTESRMPGINLKENTPSLPMPVRWVYILQDGTTGTLTDGVFKSIDSGGGKPSPENPIVARVGWWADDESCKINANTASSPGFWATPMTNSKEDNIHATSQPMFGEYQRFPGHPATVDIGAVLYPRKRWVPQRMRDVVSLGDGAENWDYYTETELHTMWSIAPFVRENSKGTFGGLGGEWDNYTQVKVGLADTDDRLFATYDELYFKALKASQLDFSAPRDNLSKDSDTTYSMLHNLERGGFFLTVKSQSPEVNLFSHPRLSMYPQDVTGLQPIVAAYSGALNVSLPPKVSPYDITVGVNTTIGRKAYYFQRYQSHSRHNEFGAGGEFLEQKQRNRLMWEYLKKMTVLPVPGYPEYKVAKSFLAKYPAPGVAKEQSSDLHQILLAMVDYSRATNMNNDLLSAANQYNTDGHGQTTAVCSCRDVGGLHGPSLGSLTVADQKDVTSKVMDQQAKGYGRTAGVNEVAFVFNPIWFKADSGAGGQPASVGTVINPNDMSSGMSGYVVEVVALGSAFCPAQGFHGLNPAIGMSVQHNGTGFNTGFTSANSAFGVIGLTENPYGFINPTNGGSDYPTSMLKVNATSDVLTRLVPWAGQIGPKALINSSTPAGTNVARLGTYFMPEAGAALTTWPLTKADKALQATKSYNAFNVIVFDTVGGDVNNSVQCFKIRLPKGVNFQPQVIGANPAFGVTAADTKSKTGPKQPLLQAGSGEVYSYVVPHGDWRLTHGVMNVDADVMRPHEGNPIGNGQYWQVTQGSGIAPDPGGKMVVKTGSHSMWEPLAEDFVRQSQTLSFSKFGIVAMQNETLPSGNKVSLNYPAWAPAYLPHAKVTSLLNNTVYTPPPANLVAASSVNPERAPWFGYCRRDTVVFRGSCDPAETGDFDNGVANCPDGPYINHPDDGDNRNNGTPYFAQLTRPYRKSASTFSPNRMIPSSVMFGSLPTGCMVRVPWQTLRFRPDPGMNDSSVINPPPGQPFSNYRVNGILMPRDHHLLDYWWMPVVEPYSISEPFSTRGQINMNQQLLPFGSYIERMTALYAVFQGERMLAINVNDVDKYKGGMVDDSQANDKGGAKIQVRRFINPDVMAYQFRRRYEGYYNETHKDIPAPFNVFRSATEICELWMAPERGSLTATNSEPSDDDHRKYLQWIQGPVAGSTRTIDNSFWEQHKLTGDNARERPYANIYPKLTTRSNVFRVHIVAQALRKSASSPPESFDSTRPDNPDLITAEWRGHAIIDRTIDPREKELELVDYLSLASAAPRLDRYYTYRITELKQLTD